MAIMLFTFGAMFILAGLSNNVGNLLGQLKTDLIGPQGFFVWGGLLIAIYILGKGTGFQRTSQGFIWLLIFVFAVKNNTQLQTITTQITGAQAAPAATPISQGAAVDVNPQTGASPVLASSSGGASGSSSSAGSGTGGFNPIGAVQSALPILTQIGGALGL